MNATNFPDEKLFATATHIARKPGTVVKTTNVFVKYPQPSTVWWVGGGVEPVQRPLWGGSKERSRQVTVPPRNGGAPCPDLKQRRGCFGQSPTCSSAKEVAKILPDSFKRNFKDPWRRPHMLMKEEMPSYCVQLRVKQASAPCRLQVWSAQLVRERSVCAECQSDAMDSKQRCGGDGLEATHPLPRPPCPPAPPCPARCYPPLPRPAPPRPARCYPRPACYHPCSAPPAVTRTPALPRPAYF
ncbi:hypothetical protein ANANG_G00186270 [Anguilla anguilla]|uniref:SBSPON-like C-terminal domain-containing protein n=1 Tax=Anguilla anguilla TaxID=7936 RepID=A0A9D3RRJ4_ANGAN|nr:hypothetical protein ANANG_G00186270 [Anguilla anguilla]